jgi:hypothetical protein
MVNWRLPLTTFVVVARLEYWGLLSMVRLLWILPLLLVPILPKIQVFAIAGVAILLDDFALLTTAGIGLGWRALRASITGEFNISFTYVAVLFSILIVYKCVDLAVLALIYPLGQLELHPGYQIFPVEGLLVISKTIAFLIAYWVIYTELREERDIRRVLWVFVSTVVVVVAVGFHQFFVLDHPVMTSTFRNIHVLAQYQPGRWGNADPWFGRSATGHEHLGAFIIIAGSLIGGCLLCGWPDKKNHVRWLAVLLLCCVFVMVFASSRGAWIGAVSSCSACAWFMFKQRRLWLVLRWVVLIVISLPVVCWLFDIPLLAYLDHRLSALITVFVGDEIKDFSAKDRLALFNILWNAFLNSPLIGWGPGGAGRIAEGQFMRELVEGGVLGICIFLILVMRLWKSAVEVFRFGQNPMARGVGLGFSCGLVGLGAQAMFTDLLILTKVGVPFWCLAGIVERFRVSMKEQQTI